MPAPARPPGGAHDALLPLVYKLRALCKFGTRIYRPAGFAAVCAAIRARRKMRYAPPFAPPCLSLYICFTKPKTDKTDNFAIPEIVYNLSIFAFGHKKSPTRIVPGCDGIILYRVNRPVRPLPAVRARPMRQRRRRPG